ncbi:MAG: HAD family hydrolase [Thermotogota bacterium]
MEKIKTIIFDLDGTLVNTVNVTIPAFENVLDDLKAKNLLKILPDKKEILKYIGYPIDQIFTNLFLSDDKELIEESVKLLDHYEEIVIEENENIFFDGVFEVLDYLKGKDYKIMILSNCNTVYLESILNKGLTKYIDNPYCSEMFNWKDKEVVMREIIDMNKKEEYVMVGDRKHDIKAAKDNGIKSIGCDYGYGESEIDTADIIINDIRELKDIF